jgi:hypothetical protein
VASAALRGANSGEMTGRQREADMKRCFTRSGMVDLMYLLVLAGYIALAWMDGPRRDAVIPAGALAVIVLGRLVGPRLAAVIPLALGRVVILGVTALGALVATICGGAFLCPAWAGRGDQD